MPKDFGLTVVGEDEYTLQDVTEIPEQLANVEEIGRLSLVDEKKAKQAISNLRKRVSLQLDQRKLLEANRTLDGILKASDVLADEKVWVRVLENTKTTQDLKFLAEFRERETKSLQNLMRMDSIDGQGTAGVSKISLAVQDETGNTTAIVINRNEE